VVEYARVLDLFDRPLHPYTRGLLASIPRLGDRRDRLLTIKEIVDDPSQFERLPGAADGIRPWWPGHQPPPDLSRVEGTAGDHALLEVEPEHWVGVWGTPPVARRERRGPDICYRVPDEARVVGTDAARAGSSD
jgi:ABC-type glutathione transport system ATPase component